MNNRSAQWTWIRYWFLHCIYIFSYNFFRQDYWRYRSNSFCIWLASVVNNLTTSLAKDNLVVSADWFLTFLAILTTFAAALFFLSLWAPTRIFGFWRTWRRTGPCSSWCRCFLANETNFVVRQHPGRLLNLPVSALYLVHQRRFRYTPRNTLLTPSLEFSHY